MGFAWDERKRRRNLADHGIDFARAVTVFDNPTLEAADDRHDYGEERIFAIGRIDVEIVVVVYTWREDRRRLISVRKADKHEREAYFAAIGGSVSPDEG